MTSRALQAIRRTVTVAWPKLQERQAKALLIRVAQNGHARIMADARSHGGEPNWEAYANRPGNANLTSVVLPGPIVYKYLHHRELIVVALKALRDASPPGEHYRNLHTLYVNGAPAVALPPIIRRSDVIFIANPRPYSRRLEIGKTKSGRDFLISVPNRIYERVAKNLIPRYRNVAKITFGYVSIPNAHTIKGRLSSRYLAKGGIRRKRRQAVGSQVQAPAIFIDLLT